MLLQPVADPDLEVRCGPALKHLVFALSQFWCFLFVCLFVFFFGGGEGGASQAPPLDPPLATGDQLLGDGQKGN